MNRADEGKAEATDPEAAESEPTAEPTAETKVDRKKERRPSPLPRLITTARVQLSRLVWIVCVLAALVLAVAALLIALGANQDNDLVKGVLNLAKVADVNVFSLDNPIKRFDPPDAATKTALLNYGLGALAWLVVGRIAAAIIRPRS